MPRNKMEAVSRNQNLLRLEVLLILVSGRKRVKMEEVSPRLTRRAVAVAVAVVTLRVALPLPPSPQGKLPPVIPTSLLMKANSNCES